jgi:dTDP-4-dehydrorhamnose 3,5-epimerase
MKVTETALKGVLVLELRSFQDPRGAFMETYHAGRYAAAGIPGPFVQDNLSFSKQGVLRGLHFQNPSAQGKLVFPLEGDIFDVAVDVRGGSPTFGKWVGVHLSSREPRQMWVPVGFAHGFYVTSPSALVAYKCTDLYDPRSEHGLLWSDPDLAIEWPTKDPLLSDKDRVYPRLRDLPREALF